MIRNQTTPLQGLSNKKSVLNSWVKDIPETPWTVQESSPSDEKSKTVPQKETNFK